MSIWSKEIYLKLPWYLSLALLVVFVTLFALVSDFLSKGTVHAL